MCRNVTLQHEYFVFGLLHHTTNLCRWLSCPVLFLVIISSLAWFSEWLFHMKCVLIFSTPFVWSISHSKNKWTTYDHYVYWSCQLLKKLSFLNRFSKVLKYQISWKSFQWEGGYFMRTDSHADRWTGRQTGMTNLIVTFQNFSNATKNLRNP